ncbi:Adenylate and Guanylate cyclase catalytic domain-containing protein [Polaromonas sp. YR568]|uniref:response regulator n=1 Tax=Polaromonas sp. YR568 TaxID=1855301 RepID=UPI0008F0A9A8|nr:response regulator [Polaromonas sp. YR568]SFU99874.1 Adenylate and Guanylate cyclase catalytic domain-containing protein [Polaromonas sp. YR568]
MPLIVVIEDDAGTRMLVTQVLKKEGHEVMSAEDGLKGLELIREFRPDVVVSDIQMPNLDGFGVLDKVRNDDALATTAVILLTSLQDRTHMRQGMTTGADDYLTKPFAPQELREAVNAQLNKLSRADAMRAQVVDKAVQLALSEQAQKISDLYETRLAHSLSQQWPETGPVQDSDRFASATVLFADMRDYGLWTQRLSGAELSDIVRRLYSSVGDTVYLFGAHYMQFVGDGMLCVFVDAHDTHSVNHGLRAMRAALGLADATKRIDAHVRQHFAGQDLPNFSLGVALHSGPVAFAGLDGLIGRSDQTTPVGDTVAGALKLFQGEPRLDWTIAASVQATRLVTGAVRTGRRALVEVAGRGRPLDTVEIVGLA